MDDRIQTLAPDAQALQPSQRVSLRHGSIGVLHDDK